MDNIGILLHIANGSGDCRIKANLHKFKPGIRIIPEVVGKLLDVEDPDIVESEIAGVANSRAVQVKAARGAEYVGDVLGPGLSLVPVEGEAAQLEGIIAGKPRCPARIHHVGVICTVCFHQGAPARFPKRHRVYVIAQEILAAGGIIGAVLERDLDQGAIGIGCVAIQHLEIRAWDIGYLHLSFKISGGVERHEDRVTLRIGHINSFPFLNANDVQIIMGTIVRDAAADPCKDRYCKSK